MAGQPEGELRYNHRREARDDRLPGCFSQFERDLIVERTKEETPECPYLSQDRRKTTCEQT